MFNCVHINKTIVAYTEEISDNENIALQPQNLYLTQ